MGEVGTFGGSAEVVLDDGTEVRVAVQTASGEKDAERLARAGLDGAAGAIASARDRTPPSDDELVKETGIVGGSEKMLELFRMLDRIRGSNATVLVLGENGTGKELVAKAIHRMSKRSSARFVARR